MALMHPSLKHLTKDARHLQIFVLGSLLLFGVSANQWEIPGIQIILVFAAGLSSQWFASRIVAIDFEWRSAAISCLSILLLLRSQAILLVILAAVLAVSSKFLLRINNRHIFNPTNCAIVLLLASGAEVWVSPGQWGRGLVFLMLVALAGTMILGRVKSSLVTGSFIITHITSHLCRTVYLGETYDLFIFHSISGSLLIFAFLMISDPMTVPTSKYGQVAFGTGIALLGFSLLYYFYLPEAYFWALFCGNTALMIAKLISRPSWRHSKFLKETMG